MQTEAAPEKTLATDSKRGAASEEQAWVRESLPAAPEALAPLPFVREDLYGSVLDRNSRAPVAGAIVVVFEPESSYDGRERVMRAVLETDGAGRFRSAAIGAHQSPSVLVQAKGYRRCATTLMTGRAHVVLLDKALLLSGRVLQAHDRRPLAGVSVSLMDDELWDGTALVPDRVQTDAEGRFSLENVPANEKIALRLRPEGWWRVLHRLTTEQVSIEGLEILLPSPLALRLRMVDLASGVPFAGLQGSIDAVGAFVTDRDGVVTIQLPPEELRGPTVPLVIESAETCTTRIQAPLERAAEILDVPLSRGATVE